MLKEVLITIGLFFTNFFVPDFGSQFLVALGIGLILPEKVVEPIHKIILKIPGVKKFESVLSKNKRLQTIIPRIIAGYFFTYLIGAICLLLAYLLG
ncbi:MAG: hypothetical protein KQA36_00610 [Candidatus Aenigmarchaeota archaeon]|nr:hypothetical protein [Candidatus Aenigmarchaeota archaeon]